MKLLSRTAGLIALCASLFVPLFGQQGAPMPMPATPDTPAAFEELIGPINMPGDSVDSTLALVERWTGRSVLRPQNLPEGRITLILRDKVTKREAIQAVETLL